MAEILVIFPPDKETAARRIGTALESAGHSSILEPAAGPDGESIARKAAGRAAAVLIWSRPFAAAADLGEWPAGLRHLPNLIEVSTDGIAPQSGDERAVVLLSGWRGQPFHLGWQRVLDELARLGARRAAPSRPAPPPAEGPAPGPAAAPRPAKAGAGGRGLRVALPAAAALALLGAVGGAAWLGSNRADPPPPSSPPPDTAGPAAAAVPKADPEAVAGAAPAALQSSPPAPTAAAAPETAPAPSAEPAPPPVRMASAPSAKAIRPPPKRRPAAEPPPKRYSKKHSKTMRLFCARSGRSTPQCRTFARSMAADR